MLSVGAAADGETPPVLVGDPAPLMSGVAWVRGERIESWDAGHVYIVDFWATWCAPCIQNLRHLQAIHSELDDQNVHALGVAIWSSPGTISPEEMLADMPELEFSMAIDRDDAAATAFMIATRSTGLPNTMIIDGKGRLAWVGEPLSGFEDVLESILAGSWDIESFRREDGIRHEAAILIGKAAEAETSGDFRGAMDIIGQAIAVSPERFSAYYGWQYEIALLRLEDGVAARGVADRFLASPQRDDPDSLLVLATRIVHHFEDTPEDLQDLDLALTCASRAVEKNPEPSYDSWTLLAKVHVMRGEFSQAVNAQENAVRLAPVTERSAAEDVLEDYLRETSGQP